MIYGINNRQLTDATVNLAIEEYCFRHLHPEADIFLLYVNSPAVIIGRHQNPLVEINTEFARKKKLRVVRRISGGGAVYHDQGNLNYSMITSCRSDSLANIHRLIDPMVAILNQLGIAARIGARNDIVIDSYKISGTAQFSNTRRLLVHGTLLFDTDLETLARAIAPAPLRIVTRSRQSIRSPVGNISVALKPGCTFSEFRDHVWAAYAASVDGIEPIRLRKADWQKIFNLANTQYRSWEWTYARSPDFALTLPIKRAVKPFMLTLHVRRWRIRDVTMDRHHLDAKVHRIVRRQLLGRRFDIRSVRLAVAAMASPNGSRPSRTAKATLL